MALSRRSASATAEPPKEWEDEYRRMKTKYDELKLAYNDKDELCKMLQVNIRKLESDLGQLNKQMGTGVVVKSNTPEDRDERNMVGVLNDQVLKLKAQVKSLKEKNTHLTEELEKKTRQLKLAKSTAYLKDAKHGKERTDPVTEVDIVPTGIPVGSHRPHTPTAAAPAVTHSTIGKGPLGENEGWDMARKFKARLDAAEEQLARLGEENTRLKSLSKSKAVNVDLENQLRDTNWRLEQLQVQYNYLNDSTKMAPNRFAELEEYSQKVRELRRTLEELRQEKEISDAKAARTSTLEDTVMELRQANRSLEDKIARLCEAPFISDAFGQHEAKLRYEEAIRERDELRMKTDHMQEALATLHAALTSLKQQAAQLREEKEESDRRAEQTKIKLGEVQNGSNMLQDQLRLYSGDDGISTEDLERALTMIKRRGEASNKLHFLEDPDGESLVSMPGMKRKLEEYQMLNLRLTEENERLDSMLKMQASVNEGLRKELEAILRGRDKENKEMLKKKNDSEELALKRLDKIHSLEAQLRQHIYGLTKHHKKGGAMGTMNMPVNDLTVAEVGSDDEDNALLAELLEDKGEDLRPDENLMEIWIKSAVIKDNGLLPPGSSTFVVIDFFDYESQTTSLLSGIKPNWDFASTYRLTVDDFLLRYLAVDVVTLELNMASQGDFTLLARCTLPVSALLKSKPRLKLVNYPMLSVKTGQIVAHITLDIRLALPVSELYRLFLERHPNERAQIEEISAKRMLEAASINELSKNMAPLERMSLYSGEDESRLYNELEIIIHRVNGLHMSADKRPPSAYVHFQLLGNPDKFTTPKLETCDPVFNEVFTFPMITNDQQLRLLSRSKLQLSVIDVKGEELDMKNEGLIGEVSVSLAMLPDGLSIADTFVVKDPNGNKTGELQITIKWKHVLKKHREIGPLGLSGLDVELLISSFAPADFNEGIVDYQRFISFFTPSREAMIAMDKIRKFCIETCDREGTTCRQIFDVYFPPTSSAVNEHTFVETMLKTHVDVLPTDLVALFQFICGEDETLVTIDKCLAVMSLDEVSGIPWGLCNKLRDRAQDLASRGISVKQLFEDADQWGGKGLVTRMEFKNVLKHMGFKLVDEMDPIMEAGENFRPSRALLNDDKGRQQESKTLDDDVLEDNDIMNDTMDAQDDVLMQTKSDLKSALGGAGTAGGQSVNAVMKQQRKQFEDKKNDLQKRSSQVLEMEMAAQAERSLQERGQQLQDPVQFSRSSHRAGAVGGKGDRSKIPDGDVTRMSATKLQSVYRGHATRRQLAGASPERPTSRPTAAGKPATSTAVVPLDTSLLDSAAYESTSGLQKVSIIDVEDLLAQSFRESTPQLKEALALDFSKLDRQRTGFVNRKQFAHVMKQHPTIALYGTQLRTCMDFFDLSNDGTKIDFNAFLRFCHYQPPELLPSLQKLNSMVMHRDSVRKFSKYDANGSGFIKRADFFKGLTECGYGQISQSILLEMMQLFETRHEGLVNYANFVEFVRGNQLCAHFERVAEALFKLITVNNTPGDVAVREWFGKIDRLGHGKFSIQNFSDFLVAQGLECPKEVVVALYSEFDPDNLGVQYSQFSQWLVKYAAAAHGHDDSRFANLSLAEIQKKAFHYLIAVAASQTASLESISDSYAVYDWRKDGTNHLVKSAFVRATLRAGFPFTKHDLMLVANEFAGHDGSHQVSYRKFLSWATPDRNSVANMTTSQGNALTFSKSTAVVSARSVTSMIQFLDKSFQRGIDLLSVFAKYDTTGEGRIAAGDFCAAFADLGLSTVTETEALEVAGHYRAVAYNFVLYRHIVSEVLRKADEASGARHPDVLEVIKAMLLKSPVSVKALRDKFQQYDRKLNGSIRCEDVSIVFDELRLPIRRIDLDALLEKFASGRSPDWLPYDQFIKALEGRINDKPLLSKTGRKGHELSEDLSMKCKNMIEHLILKGVDYRAVFDNYDPEISGCMSQNDFRKVLENFDRSFTAMELQSLEHVYKVRGNSAKVDFIRFLHHLHPRNFGRVTFNDDGLLEKEAWEIAEVLRQKIRKHSHDDYTSIEELHRNFRHFARRRGEASVTLDDFARAVRDLGVTLSPDQEREVFNMINLNGGRHFRFSEFAVFVCDPQHLDIVWKLRRAVQRANIAEKEIGNALNLEDASGLGLISGKQFRKAMKSCSIDLSDSDILRLMRRFDTEENQRLDIAKFRQFLKGRDLEEENTENKHPNRTESHTWNRLKDAVEDKLFSGMSPNEVFSIFDQDGLEKLDVVALHNGCRELGLVVSRDEVKSILRRMCQLIGGEVTRKRFFEALDVNMDDFRNRSQESRYRNNRSGGYGGDERRDSRGGYGGGSGVEGDHVRTAFRKRPELLEEVVHQINVALKANPRSNIGQLWESMKRLDYSRQGLLGKADFSRCLLSFGLMMKSGFERDLIDSISNENARGQEVDYLSFQSLVEAELKPLNVDVGGGRGSSRDRVSDKLRADTDSIIKLVRRRIEDHLGPGASSGRKVREAFNDIDRDHNMRIDKREFGRAMNVLKVDLDDRDIDLLFDRFDYNRSGYIEYKEFLDLIDFEARPNTARDSSSKLKNDTDEIIKLVRRKIEDHLGPGAGSTKRVKEVFEEIDRDGNRKIDKREFGRAMGVLKVNLHARDIDLLYDRFDYNRSGFIEYKEFLDLIDFDARPNSARGSGRRGEMSEKLRSDTDNIIKLVRRRIEDYLGPGAGSGRKVRDAFDEIDRDRNMKIDKREFGRAMNILKVDLDDRDIDLLFDRFDYNRSGYIEYKEFLDLIDFDVRPNTARDSSSKLKNDTDEIIKLVRRKIEDHLGPGAGSTKRVKEVFDEIDRDGNRKIDKREFGRAMGVLKVNLHARDIDLLYDRFDHDRSGYIEYKEFLELIDFDTQPRSPRGSSRSSDRLRNDTDDIIKTVRRRLEDHLGPGAHSSRKIRDAFDEIDRDHNNKIDKREFGKAMSILKVDLHPRDVDLLYERFDYNRSGFIEYKEFLDLIDFNKSGPSGGGSTSSSRGESIKADAERIIKRVRSKLEDHLGPGAGSARRIREVFDDIDRDRNNKLDKRELSKAMSILKADLDDRDIDTLYERFDYNHSGFIEYKEFLDLIDFNVSDKLRRDSDDIIRTVRDKLETYLGPGASSARKIREVFDEIDYDHNMKIDKREFSKAMSRLKVDMSSRDVDTLYERFDHNRSGFIEYKEFLDLLGFHKTGSGSSSGSSGSGRGSSSDRERVREESDDIIKAVRHRLEDHLGHGSGSSRKIREAFDDIDRDRNNKIDKREFSRAMDILKVKVSARDIDTLFDRFDTNRSGFIEYKEFLELIDYSNKPSARGGVKEEAEYVIRTVRRNLQDYLGPGANSERKIREAFDEIDADHNNKLDKREFSKAMQMLKVDISTRDIDTLYERFDRNRSGTIEYKEFLELLDFSGKSGGGGSSTSYGRSDGPSSSRVSDRVREESDDIIKTVRHRLEDHLGHGSGSTRKIREAFDDIDRDRNNKIDKREFSRAMDILKVKLSSRDVDTLFDRFDTNRSGFIEYKEFLELIDYSNKPSARGGVKEEAEYVIRTVRRNLQDYLGPGANSERKIREAFDEIDADHNNKLDKREFSKAMQMLKVDISTRDIDTLYERFDRNRSGTIEYKEFLELLDFSGKSGGGGSSTSYGRSDGPSGSKVSERVREESDNVLRTIRRQLERHMGPGSQNARKLRDTFDEIDLNGDRAIDKREFIKAMRILKVDVETRDVDAIYERFDRNRNGKIDYKEFLELLDFGQEGSGGGGRRDNSESKR